MVPLWPPHLTVEVARLIQGDTSFDYSTMPLLAIGSLTAAHDYDPVPDANPYSSGIAPKRVYLAHFQQHVQTGAVPQGCTACSNSEQVIVSRSDDGGGAWPAHAIVESDTTPTWFLDKPDMTVSLHSGSLGYVYVTYTRINFTNPALTEIRLERSTNGGVGFSQPSVSAIAVGDTSASQVIVNPYYGTVYVLWVDESTSQIKMRSSSNYGVSFGSTEVVASGLLMTFKTSHLRGSTVFGANATQARTVSQTRFDWDNNRIGVVWNESEKSWSGTHGGTNQSQTVVDNAVNFATAGVVSQDWVINTTTGDRSFIINVTANVLDLASGQWCCGSGQDSFNNGDHYVIHSRNSDIYYTSKYYNGITSVWQPKVKLDVMSANGDQWQPSIDFRTTGDLLVGYYHRTTFPKFEARWIRIDMWGTKQSDGVFPNSPESDVSTSPNNHFGWIGDYTDTFYWNYPFIPGDPWGGRWHFIYYHRPLPSATKGDIRAGAVN